jgi:hypothetical protein
VALLYCVRLSSITSVRRAIAHAGRCGSGRIADWLELKVSKLLAGIRGHPLPITTLVAAICGLSDIYLDHRGFLSDLEINPLMVLPNGWGVRTVDVGLMRVAS